MNRQPHFLDGLLAHLNLKNDAALARALRIKPSYVSKIRHNKQGVSSTMILALHEKFNVPVATIRELLAK